ncbi:MAG TPA: type II toxin-antitoxin system ParD family antitoxin [Candidatus Baltobacteraceae bacterium]
MGTKNISLPPELEKYVDAKVASGEYAHASEVVRDAIRLLMQREAEKIEWLRNAIQEGIVAVERGDVYTEEEVFDYLDRETRAWLKDKKIKNGA